MHILKWLLSFGAGTIAAPIGFHLGSTFAASAITASGLTWANPGGMVSDLVGLTAAALGLYGALVLVHSLSSITGRQSRVAFLSNFIKWLLYALVIWVIGALAYAIGSAIGDPLFAMLLAVFSASITAYALSQLELPEYQFPRLIRGIQIASNLKQKRSFSLIPLGKDVIEHDNETLHLLVLGNIGGGKTTYLEMVLGVLLPRCLLQDECYLVQYDPKQEAVAIHEAYGVAPIILNPFDERSYRLDLHRDFVTDADAESLAGLLINEGKNPQEEGSLASHWQNSMLSIVQGGIRVLMRQYQETGRVWDLRDIILACSSGKDLEHLLRRDVAGGEGNLEFLKKGQGDRNDYLTSLMGKFQKLHTIAALWHHAPHGISLREWIERRGELAGRPLILGSDFQYEGILNTVNLLLIDRIVQAGLNLPDSRSRRIFFMLDELIQAVGVIGEPLDKALRLGRSRGFSIIAGIQNYQGLVAKLGDARASQLVSLFRHTAALGALDGATAKWCSDTLIGEHEVVSPHLHLNQPRSVLEKRQQRVQEKEHEKKSANEASSTRPTVLAQELMNVPPTSPATGLTGLFNGGKSGWHWHTYEWDEIQSRRLQPDAETIARDAYRKIAPTSPAYALTPWSDAERSELRLPQRPPPQSLGDEFPL